MSNLHSLLVTRKRRKLLKKKSSKKPLQEPTEGVWISYPSDDDKPFKVHVTEEKSVADLCVANDLPQACTIELDGDILRPRTLLQTFTTTHVKPLKIRRFTFYWRYEGEKIIESHLPPFRMVNSLFKEDTVAAFHNDTIILPETSLVECHTSSINPLLLKSLVVKVYVNYTQIDVTVDLDIDVQKLIKNLEVKNDCRLFKQALDQNDCAIRLDYKLITFIKETDENRVIYLKKANLPNYSFSGKSVSGAAKQSNGCITKRNDWYPVFSHWFAIEVYNKFLDTPDEAASIFSQKFEQVMKGVYRSGEYEHLYTSMCSRELDRYLFPDPQDGCCLHQPSISDNNRPDIYIATLDNHIPQVPLLVADWKIHDNDYEIAVRESHGYCQKVLTQCKKFVPLLTIPCTLQGILSLQLYWPIDEAKCACIEICKTIHPSKYANFFFALKHAIEICKIIKESSFVVEPLQGVQLMHPLKGKHVYKKGGKVYKLYEGNEFGPKMNIIKKISKNYLPGMKVNKLTADKRYLCFIYDYIPTRNPLTLDDFRPIMNALDRLHENRYVHSDIRLPNLVFPLGESAKLIDFDLADKVDTFYPDGYNYSMFPERHPEARPFKPRKVIHDRYLLITIIRLSVAVRPDEDAKLAELEANESPRLETMFV